MALYPAAGIVIYEATGQDDLLSSLQLMEQYDHEFSQDLFHDDYIYKIFTMQLEHKISKTAKKKLPVRLGTALIVRGLKNRTRFAIRQKERLKHNVNMLLPPEFKSSVIHEVDRELERVIDLIVHFMEYDPALEQLLNEAGDWLHDTLEGVSYPTKIPDDDV